MTTPLPDYANEPFPTARFIKEIGRGAHGARSMTRLDAQALFGAMLAGRVSDLELGAIMLAMRIKGESVEEIAGFLAACEASFAPLATPPGNFAPVVIPSYNGARKMANLTALLSLLLAREGVPVLVHGVRTDPGRVTTAEVFDALGLASAGSIEEAALDFARGQPSFIDIAVLAPQMAHLLSLRRILGVRNSTHTLVKIMQPFAGPALRLVSYTHPEYLEMLGQYFITAAPHERGDAFLMRGTEGETVANANKAQQIDWFHGAQRTILVQKQAVVQQLPVLPLERDAQTTATWIRAVLRGDIPVPASIAEQVAQCLLVSKALQASGSHHEQAGQTT
jgi:anthranilate phosphoribosyltransferase